MNYPLSLTLAFCTLGTLSSFAAAQQLEAGHYLVGTQGWDLNSNPDATKATVQIVSAYTGKAKLLKITGIPTGENPSTFIVSNSTDFLMGTKVAAAPAAGNVYRVKMQSDKSWKATKLNKKALGINVSGMVSNSSAAFVIGSSIFSNTGDDAQIMRIDLFTGEVTAHAPFGNKYTKKQGAMGLGSALVLVGTTLHAFTFDSAATTAKQNEHWTISTTTPVKIKQLPSLPASRRWIGRGFGTRGAFVDPMTGNLLVVGGWGELIWRDANGKDLRYERIPGSLIFNGTHLDQMWRGVTLNLDTYAFAMGDHNGASIDERRSNGASSLEPFTSNIGKAIQPTPGMFTITGMTYIASTGSYRTTGDGCKSSPRAAAPSSYASGRPVKGNQDFGLTLYIRPTGTSFTTLGVLMISSMPASLDLSAIAPGCVLRVDPFAAFVMVPSIANKNEFDIRVPLPSRHNATIHTQWFVLTPGANALGGVLSDSRKLISM